LKFYFSKIVMKLILKILRF